MYLYFNISYHNCIVVWVVYDRFSLINGNNLLYTVWKQEQQVNQYMFKNIFLLEKFFYVANTLRHVPK